MGPSKHENRPQLKEKKNNQTGAVEHAGAVLGRFVEKEDVREKGAMRRKRECLSRPDS